jgi:hypothetical protein
MPEHSISELVGKTLAAIDNAGYRVRFVVDDGDEYELLHYGDCCESVQVEDVIGDLNDLVGSPILQAEESTSAEDPEGYKRDYPPESATWTFYKLATAKGYVTIRWLGESNGYYSESVDFVKVGESPL